MKKTQLKNKGFTLIELMVALTVLTLLGLFAGRIYLSYTATSLDLKGANLVYEESRFLMEKIVREVRQNGIDYEQYWNQNVAIPLNNGDGNYTDNYCEYSSFFYDNEGESIGKRNSDLEDQIVNINNLDPAAIKSIENELYLINVYGDKRTILTRVEKEIDGETIGKMAILKMNGKDFGTDHIDSSDPYNGLQSNHGNCSPDDRENDGLIDTWHCDEDYSCKENEKITNPSQFGCEGFAHVATNNPLDSDYSFVDISPNAINVVDLQFIIAPEDDPWKAYNINEVQIQPHVTIKLTTEANPKLAPGGTGRIPSVTLTSTITTRNYDEIRSECK